MPYNPVIEHVQRQAPAQIQLQPTTLDPPTQPMVEDQKLFGQFGTPGSQEFQEGCRASNTPNSIPHTPTIHPDGKRDPFLWLKE